MTSHLIGMAVELGSLLEEIFGMDSVTGSGAAAIGSSARTTQGRLDALEDQAAHGSLDDLLQGADGLLNELADNLLLDLLPTPVAGTATWREQINERA